MEVAKLMFVHRLSLSSNSHSGSFNIHHRPNYTTAARMAARHSCSHSNHTLPHAIPLCYHDDSPLPLIDLHNNCVCFRSVGWCSHAAYTEGLSWILTEPYRQAPPTPSCLMGQGATMPAEHSTLTSNPS